HADVLLVALLLEILEEGKNPLVRARARREQQLPVGGRECAPGYVHGDAARLGEFGQRSAAPLVARFRPGIDRAITQRVLRVRYDERLVVFQRRPESVAGGAGAARIVEAEELRRRHGRPRAIMGALEALGEAQAAPRSRRLAAGRGLKQD